VLGQHLPDRAARDADDRARRDLEVGVVVAEARRSARRCRWS
jgi:hypothetical protein